jgi:predicted 3-demethylubiquinone-9 3-methyltransferase (glyoxalase superfamily)
MKQKITPFLWFEKDMDAVLEYYKNIFHDLKILSRQKVPETPSQTVEVVEVEIFESKFTWMTAGPYFKFNEAISFVVDCDGQEEVDKYWDYFTREGQESQCGWCKDKYGVSWQIIPKQLNELMGNSDSEVSKYAVEKMLQMKKIIVKDLMK